MSSNIRALRTKDISPMIVLQTLQQDLAELTDLYVVAFDQDGQPRCYATGDLGRIALAAACFQDLTMKHINGDIDEE